MKKKITAFISVILLSIGIGFHFLGNESLVNAKEEQIPNSSVAVPVPSNGPSLLAIPSILRNNKFTQLGSDDTIPEGYYFFAQPNVNTRYFKVNEKTREKISEFKIKSPGSNGLNTNYINMVGGRDAVYFSDVGEYNGKTIDMMVNLEPSFTGRISYEKFTSDVDDSFGVVRFVKNGKDNNTFVTYSYFDHDTGEPAVIKGIFNSYFARDFTSPIKYDTTLLDGLFVNKTSVLFTDTRYETETLSRVYGDAIYSTAPAESANNYVTSIFTGSTNRVNMYMQDDVNVEFYSMAIQYNKRTVARVKTPVQGIKGSVETDGSKHATTFNVKINQSIPARLSNFKKYSNFSYTLPTNDLYQLKSFKVIRSSTGVDVSNNFTLSGNQLEYKAAFLNQEAFYGENYTITLSYSLDTTKDIFGLYEDGYLVMPYDPVIQTTNLDGTQTSNSTTAKIKWDYQLEITANDLEYSQGEVKRFLKELTPDGLKEKILTESNAKGKNLNLNTDIPVTVNDILLDSAVGSYPVTLSTSDGDVTLTKDINVNVKAIPPKVSIPENGTTVVSSKGVPYTINGTMSDEDSENLSLFVTVDDGQPTTILDKQVNEELNQPIDFTYEIPGTQLTELGDHTVKIYAKDGEGNQSEIAQFTLDIRGYLAFKELPPATLDFDAAKISSKGSYAKLNKSVDFSVEDYRGSNTSWKLVGSLITELKDSATNTTLTDGIIYRDEDGNETPFTKGASVKLSTGKATSSNVLFPIKWGAGDNGIFIKTPPDVKKGNYKGSIEMSLVDAP